MRRTAWTRPRLVIFLLLVGAIVALGTHRQALADWLRLRNYTAPTSVVQLATDNTMTPQARHLFYVNHPSITSGKAFTSHCPLGGEKTVVLGCYVGSDSGIYLYSVNDGRLQGVEQVTAAHEMLHAAYRRLPGSERTRVDALLNDFYAHHLTDQRIKDTIAAYKKSEPNDVVNEMHSVFGTEVANLPAPLEQYYKQFFTDRSKVTSFTASYQAEFSSRQAMIKQYDMILDSIKQQIDANQANLSEQKTAIDSQSKQLDAERSSNQAAAYNKDVASYNAAVDSYNGLLAITKNVIRQYNDIVNRRNAVVLEEQQLTQAISASATSN